MFEWALRKMITPWRNQLFCWSVWTQRNKYQSRTCECTGLRECIALTVIYNIILGGGRWTTQTRVGTSGTKRSSTQAQTGHGIVQPRPDLVKYFQIIKSSTRSAEVIYFMWRSWPIAMDFCIISFTICSATVWESLLRFELYSANNVELALTSFVNFSTYFSVPFLTPTMVEIRLSGIMYDVLIF